MLETLLWLIGAWILKKLADWWVKKSKMTANKIDDIVSNILKQLLTFIFSIINLKRKKNG
jgi:hypothetical protein